jgi:lactate dehydrogenase-like 2-hydroxyacid dehydrogenase
VAFPNNLHLRERTPIPKELFSALPNLKLLCTTGIRNLALDLAAAKAQNVPVVGTLSKHLANPRFASGYDSTNEQTWALILGLAKILVGDDSRVKNGEWQSGLNIALAGKTLGLLGLGKLGTQCAVTGRLGFGM